MTQLSGTSLFARSGRAIERGERYILPSKSPPRTTPSLESTGLKGRIPEVMTGAKKRGPKPGYKRTRTTDNGGKSQMQHEPRSIRSRQESDSKRRDRKARKSSNSPSPRQRSPNRFGQIYSAPSLLSYGMVRPPERTDAAQYLQSTENPTVVDEPVQSKGQMLSNHDQISHIESQHGRPTESSGYRVSAIGNTHHRLGDVLQVRNTSIAPAVVSDGARSWTEDTNGYRAPSSYRPVQRTEESCWQCRVSGRICTGGYGKRCRYCTVYGQTCVYVVDKCPLPQQERDVAEVASHSIMKVESRCYESGVPHEIIELVRAIPYLRDCNGNLVVTDTGAFVFFVRQEFLYHPTFDSLRINKRICQM